MIKQMQPLDQLQKNRLSRQKVLKHLNAAGFKKKFGFTSKALWSIGGVFQIKKR
ncbi:hypothetical protein ACVLD2_002755 [Paenibacillus sp. PvR052]|nr:hypothetical protein [Paenibacillus sp. PvP091]MBP1172473.1 hypothetical protein [Paenibacillus sp. PvR098]MBP2438854.1 hypothetical protein [Paenibacillus sp. PvP052]